MLRLFGGNALEIMGDSHFGMQVGGNGEKICPGKNHMYMKTPS
jgi:hypothetical protein